MWYKSRYLKINPGQCFLFLLLVSFFVSCSKSGGGGGGNGTGTPVYSAEITVQLADDKQLIQGFGCATVFTPPNTTVLTSPEFDRLFGTAAGQVGLSLLRIRIAADDSWRATELNYAKEAIRNGARIIASPWSPPARMKTNNSLIGGKLITDSGAAYARYLNDFAVYMAANNAPVYAVSVQNEPDITVSYESCDWTADEMRVFLRNHGQLVTATRLMAPESFNNNQAYVNTLLEDAAAESHIDLVGGHIYGSGLAFNPLVKAKGKEVWMTEHLDTNYSYTASLNTAVEIHDCLTKAEFNAYCWWYGKRFYGPLGQDGQVTKRGVVMSHFARFIRPGSVRLGTGANSRTDVLVSAYRNGTKRIIVAINKGSVTVSQKFQLQGGTAGTFVPYVTTSSRNAEQGTAVNAAGNSVTIQLPPGSITTLVEQ